MFSYLSPACGFASNPPRPGTGDRKRVAEISMSIEDSDEIVTLHSRTGHAGENALPRAGFARFRFAIGTAVRKFLKPLNTPTTLVTSRPEMQI